MPLPRGRFNGFDVRYALANDDAARCQAAPQSRPEALPKPGPPDRRGARRAITETVVKQGATIVAVHGRSPRDMFLRRLIASQAYIIPGDGLAPGGSLAP